jgi:hypothetical protein
LSSWLDDFLSVDPAPSDKTRVAPKKQLHGPVGTDARASVARGQNSVLSRRPVEQSDFVQSLLQRAASHPWELVPGASEGAGVREGLDLAKGGSPIAGAALAASTFIPIPGLKKLAGKFIRREMPKPGERFAILTAENPGGTPMDAAGNARRRIALEKELKERGYQFTPGSGRYKDNQTGSVMNENSFVVYNMPEREAKLVGRRYGQNSVITQAGYHDLVDGKLYPSRGIAEAKDLPYTELEGGKRFALDIDWEKPVTSNVNKLPVPKGANPEVLRVAEDLRRGKPGKDLPRVKAVNAEKAAEMAKVYESLPKNDPAAKEAYDALNAEVDQQFKALEDAGYKIEFTDSDPYKSSKEMMEDVQKNRTLKVFRTPRPAPDAALERTPVPRDVSADDVMGEYESTYRRFQQMRDKALAPLEKARDKELEALRKKFQKGKIEKAEYNELAGQANLRFEETAQPIRDEYIRSREELTKQYHRVEDKRKGLEQKIDHFESGNFHPYMTPEQNDRFRAVHDWLAHAGEGHSFGPTGEENAYRVHASTLSPQAQRALATETRGQNSWVNFGPNAHLPAKERPFAEQKAALWPEGLLGDYSEMPARDYSDAGSRIAPTTAPAVITPPSQQDVFDVSKLGLDVPAGVTTERPPLKYPTDRTDMSAFDAVIRNFRRVYTPNVERAIKETPSAAGWYDMTQVRDAMEPSDFEKFMLFMGPTSSGTKVFDPNPNMPDNIRLASDFYRRWKQDPGKLLRDVKDGTLDLEKGYKNRRQASLNSGVARILETGNLDPFETAKTFRYANQLAGRMWGGAALDMHVGRQVGRRGRRMTPQGELVDDVGFPLSSEKYRNEKIISGSPASAGHYARIEDGLVNEANRLGLAPSQYQALGWVGGGAKTNVSDTRPLLGLLNEKLRTTADKYGTGSTMKAWELFKKGEIPLWALTGMTAGGLLSSRDEEY